MQEDGGQLPETDQDPEMSGQEVGPEPPSLPQPNPNGATSTINVKILPEDFMSDLYSARPAGAS